MNIELFIEQLKEIVSVMDDMNFEKSDITLTYNENDFYVLLNHFDGTKNRVFRDTKSFNIEIENIQVKILKN